MDPGASDISTILRITCQSDRADQKDIILPGGSILIQYVYDLLLASKTDKDCLKDTIFPCTALASHLGISLFKDVLERCPAQAVMLLIKSTSKTLL